MNKKLIVFIVVILLSLSLNAKIIDSKKCSNLGENFIFAGGECIETRAFKGEDNEHIMIIVHGIWDEGTNILGRYAPFAETMNLNTDLTTIAIALPGYSKSSTNNLLSLANKRKKNQAASKEYVLFLSEVIKTLKEKYNAKKVTFIGHSAGARMGATVTGLKPDLVQNIALIGGRYEVREENKAKGLISFADVIDNVNKNTKYLFIYGTKDTISKPEVTIEFFKIAKQKGLNAKMLKVDGAGHIDLDMTDESIEAIISMIEEED